MKQAIGILLARMVFACTCAATLMTSFGEGAQVPPSGRPSPFPKELRTYNPPRTTGTARHESFYQAFQFQGGQKQIRWVRHERADAQSPWYKIDRLYTTSFEIASVCAREGGDVLFVSGVTRGAGGLPLDVIEKWTFPIEDGRWIHRAASPSQPIGTPSGTYVGITSIKADVPFLPPTEHPEPVREQLFASSIPGRIRTMQVDPEGRYLLLLEHSTGDLYQIDLLANPVGEPLLICGVAQYPSLSVANVLAIADHVSEGRKVIVTDRPEGVRVAEETYLMLSDADNNGLFEAVQVFTGAQWNSSSDYGDVTKWQRPWVLPG